MREGFFIKRYAGFIKDLMFHLLVVVDASAKPLFIGIFPGMTKGQEQEIGYPVHSRQAQLHVLALLISPYPGGHLTIRHIQVIAGYVRGQSCIWTGTIAWAVLSSFVAAALRGYLQLSV